MDRLLVTGGAGFIGSNFVHHLMEHTDVCFAPVLRLSETAGHPHNIARSVIVDVDGVKQPAPAPRFSRTVPTLDLRPAHAGQHTREILEDWGVAKDRIDALVEKKKRQQLEDQLQTAAADGLRPSQPTRAAMP